MKEGMFAGRGVGDHLFYSAIAFVSGLKRDFPPWIARECELVPRQHIPWHSISQFSG